MIEYGILFVSSYTRHRPLANAACLVAGTIVISLAFHPTAKVSTPIAGEFPSVQLNLDDDDGDNCRRLIESPNWDLT
jgi:hypothetical protein